MSDYFTLKSEYNLCIRKENDNGSFSCLNIDCHNSVNLLATSFYSESSNGERIKRIHFKTFEEVIKSHTISNYFKPRVEAFQKFVEENVVKFDSNRIYEEK